jgi:hypothetical protein
MFHYKIDLLKKLCWRQVIIIYCKDCVFFKQWKYFDAAICTRPSGNKPVEALSKVCQDFIPRGPFSEWGEETCGPTCR